MRNKYATHVDFTFLSEVSGKKIPSNIDMILERRGCFLVGEWKRPHESVSKGQIILLNALAQNPQFTVLLITGHSDDEATVVYDIQRIEKSGELTMIGDSVEDLKKLVSAWLTYTG